jgi:DNA transposition AAA+ family ATPase
MLYPLASQLRNIYDRSEFGMVLIGMPGIERRISRYPQLYSGVGFLHEFKTLSKDEMILIIIENHLNRLGTEIKRDNFSDYETLNTVVRITKGNLRVLTRLFQQLERLMKINNITSINTDLVNVARDAPVIER